MSSHVDAGRGFGAPLTPHEREACEHARLGFWIFLGSESVFFATLIGTYLALHTHVGKGPGPHVLDITLTGIATVLLSTSGLTMALAVAAAHRYDLRRMRAWLVVTIVLGLLFVGNQVLEFSTLYAKGVTLQSSAFASSFFTLTGFHGLHVAFGCAWMIVWLVQTYRRQHRFGERETTQFEVTGLYWAFVDVVWVVIFPVVYLIGAIR